MDLQEKRQLDLARQVSVVKARTRPWRSIIALVLAVAAAIVSLTARDVATEHVVGQVIAIAAAVAFFGLAVIAVIGFAGKSRDVMQPVTGRAHAAVVRYTIVLVGSIAALFITLALLDVPIDQLLVGGAVTSIILGIAAQQALGNVFSGLVLLFSHPFGVGDAVSFRSGAFGGQIDGIVTEIGISYVRVETAEGTIRLPNSQVLASAVGPADQAEQADREEQADRGERAGQAEQADRAEQTGQAGLAGQISPAEQVGQVEQGGGKGQAGQMPTQAAMGKAPRGSPPAG